MELKDVTIGMLVQENKAMFEGDRRRIGHITGLTLNSFIETIIVVHWAGENDPSPIHHCNVSKLS